MQPKTHTLIDLTLGGTSETVAGSAFDWKGKNGSSGSSMLLYGFLTFVLMLLCLVHRYSLFIPAPHGLPILLYHKISRDRNDRPTISVDRLDRQLAYIKSNYTPVSFQDLKESLAGRHPMPAKSVLVTFDDGYLSMYELAFPLLLKHQVKATIFLPTGFIGGTDGWNGAKDPLMSYDLIRKMAGMLIEVGLHSYSHQNYGAYSAEQVETDVNRCVRELESSSCPFTRVVAYPYGQMPTCDRASQAMRESFRRHGIDFALRIGSRINPLPPKDPYALKRTGVNGTDSFGEFKIKLQKGRVKLF
jgi:peptidoglycan/xylan/chitin deacetylase (PgdA/CDA1 family)